MLSQGLALALVVMTAQSPDGAATETLTATAAPVAPATALAPPPPAPLAPALAPPPPAPLAPAALVPPPAAPLVSGPAPSSPAVEGPVLMPPPVAHDLDDVPPRSTGFVLSASLGINFVPVFPVPSGEFSLFLGRALPITPRRHGHWLALGYRGTLSLGYADIFLTDRSIFGHRHHLAIQGAAGPRGRLYYGASAGFAGFTGLPPVSGRRPPGDFALEGEGRLGAIFDGRATRFIFGVQLRVSGRIGQEHGLLAFPTLGLFFGFNFGPGLQHGRVPSHNL